jgi:raffinose/stachyose/melibiose transport system substrate-binding protein
MTALTRRWRAAALLAGVALVLAACGGGADTPTAEPGAGDPNQPVTLTWWHNGTADPGKSYYQSIADAYQQAHPNVTIKVQPLQNEQFNTKIPVALQSNNPPDIFQQWGGGQLADQVRAGKVQDLTEAVRPWIGTLGPAVNNWQVDGKQYGIPYSFGIVGFWYNTSLFQRAGITQPPATFEELLGAVQKLKAAGVAAPIAIGSKDKWPDAFYWDYLALRLCSQEVMQRSAADYNFDDPCWTRAGELVKQLIDAQPFQKGFLATPAQQGAGSSAGLLANGKAGMELMGHWNPGVMQSLTPDKKVPDGLGWFPFPAVSGGAGNPDAALGGGDGFSCSFKAPPACADFLKFLVSVDNQKRFGELNIGLPVAAGSETAVADPNLKRLVEFRNQASYIQTYLDVAYATSVGQALNDAIAQQFAGQLDAAGVVEGVKSAAASR